jgi:Rab-GTPase-TBC domain
MYFPILLPMDITIELVRVKSNTPQRLNSREINLGPETHRCNCKKSKLHSKCNMICRSLSLDSCTKAHFWCHIAKIPMSFPSDYYSISIESRDQYQINLDLLRTFPENSFFNSGHGSTVLGRVLNRFANFLPNPGYVQGINYICAALLWHTSEANAFYLLVKLMQDYKLRENFVEGLPGLASHSEKIELYIKKLWPKLHKHLNKHGIVPGMFMTDWCITIFTNIIPIDHIGKFLSYFFKYGWEYFYKLSIEIIERLKKKIMKLNDRLEILTTIKPFQLLSDHQTTFLKSLSYSSEKNNWDKILSKANKRKLGYIM